MISKRSAIGAALGLIALSGCSAQDLADFAASIPPMTPEEQCHLDNGRWQSITNYDANGVAMGSSGQCVETDARPPDAERHRK